jgi:predicted metal-dependent peptidase
MILTFYFLKILPQKKVQQNDETFKTTYDEKLYLNQFFILNFKINLPLV